MAILKIAQLGEPVLRQVAAPVDPAELGSADMQRLIDDMVETMHDANGAGLAAPQVYRSVQVVVMEVNANLRYPEAESIALTTLVNPRVVSLVGHAPLAEADTISVYEGCLSVAGLRGQVRRPRSVRVQALDRKGVPLEFQCDGFMAAVVQHEVDHLAGRLFVDRVEPQTLCFLREYERYVPPASRIVDGRADAE
jgi:peptide deformylase